MTNLKALPDAVTPENVTKALEEAAQFTRETVVEGVLILMMQPNGVEAVWRTYPETANARLIGELEIAKQYCFRDMATST